MTNSPNVAPPPIIGNIKDRMNHAHKELCHLADTGGKGFTMSIPPHQTRDSDLIIQNSLDDIPVLISAFLDAQKRIEALKGELAMVVASHKRQCDINDRQYGIHQEEIKSLREKLDVAIKTLENASRFITHRPRCSCDIEVNHICFTCSIDKEIDETLEKLQSKGGEG